MGVSYSCRLVKYSDESGEGFKDSVAIIFNFKIEEKGLHLLYKSLFEPFITLPLKPIKELESIVGLNRNYLCDLFNFRTYEVSITSDTDFTLSSRDVKLEGKIDLENLKQYGFYSLFDLHNEDVLYGLLFTTATVADGENGTIYYNSALLKK
ncbi:hypothetical protein [Alkalihalobacterium bogoriense]|uniref:hypothetical protein n=1 Tax=Alkalihalobacterium bogoriense TaxID=246272 RepID=UPI00047E427B|nr:hypothetical protein [Alkalihalobacterium bogoriense]